MRAKLEDVCVRGSSNLKQSDVIDKTGEYPIYGAAGYIGNVDFYHQDQPYVAVVKDGAGIGRTSLYPAESSVIGTMQYLLPKAKAEYYVRQHQDNEAIAKLKSNQPLTSEDIKNLENIMWSEIGTKQDYEAEYGEKPLGEFVREIVGLDMTAAKEAFAEYLDETNLDSRQIYFVNQIVEFIVHNGMMKDLSVLQEPPFTDQGSIVEVFTDLSVWMGIRKAIEQVNANALAA